MPSKPRYRLEVLVRIKERAKRQTEIALAKVLVALEEEKEKLKKLHESVDALRQKKEKARVDMRNKVASGQSRIKDSQFHLGYLTKLKEDEEALEKEITEQKEVIIATDKKLKRARRDYQDAASELNVMQKHRELWIKKQHQALTVAENKQMNDLGNTLHQINKMKAS